MEPVSRLGSGMPLVGRAAEFKALVAALDRARAGEPAAVLLSGDAGVGKTRLLGELMTWARAAGMTVLEGHCVDMGDVGLPYLPFADALQRLSDAPAVVAGAAGPGSPLAGVLADRPVLGRLLPGRVAGASADASLDDLGQLQLFDAVTGVLRDLAAAAPVLLVLEDLHWADQSTRDLLSFLLSRLRIERLAVVASYRADDLHRRHPLRPLLAELVRLPVVERVSVRPFTAIEARRFVRTLYDGPLPESAVRRLAERSEGNAFFAEELLAASVDASEQSLPTALADLLLARLERLPAAVQHVVRVAAVAGRRISHPLLRQAAGLADEELEAALREAVTRYLLVPDDGDAYAFRHALLQEAVYGDLLPGERVRLHATFARLLADPDSSGSAAELAHHCLQSHDLHGALLASLRAAKSASRLGAPAEALGHYEQALQLWPAVPGADRDTGVDEVRLGQLAAAAAGAAGELPRAVALAREALSRVDAVAEPEAAARAGYQLAHHLLAVDRVDDAYRATTDAVRLVLAGPPSQVRIRATATHARAAGGLRRDEEARVAAERALTGARELGADDVQADALTTLAVLDERASDPEAAAVRLADAHARAVASGDVAVELRAVYNLGVAGYEAGDNAGALCRFAEGVRRADAVGLGWSDYAFEMRVLTVIAHYVAGDWDASLRAADVAGERPPDTAAARLAATSLYVEVGRGIPGTVERVRRLHAEWHRDPQLILLSAGAGVDLLTWQGDLPAARAAAAAGIDRLAARWGPHFLGGIWLRALGIAAEADRAAEARLRQDAGTVAESIEVGTRLAEEAREVAQRGRARSGRLGPEGRAWLVRADAESSRLRAAADPEPWRAALAAFGYGYPYEQARCRWRLAEALLADDQRDEAAAEARAAHGVAVGLGAVPLRTAVEALVRRGRLDAGLSGQPSRVASGTEGGPLTPRERDVLAQLALGRTNRQIGRALFISEKTASVHVSNIIGKLHASGRTEVVAIASRRGLLDVTAFPATNSSPA